MAKVAKVLNPGVQKVSRDPPIPLVPPALYNEYLKGQQIHRTHRKQNGANTYLGLQAHPPTPLLKPLLRKVFALSLSSLLMLTKGELK